MKRIFKVLLVLGLAANILLIVLVSLFPILSLDIFISQKFQAHGHVLFPFAMKMVSVFGQPTIAVATVILVSMIFFLLAQHTEAIFLLFTFPADGLSFLLKNIIHRPRPGEPLVLVEAQAGGYSFPSNHVVHYVVFFGFLFVTMFVVKKLPKWLRLLVAFGCLILIFSVSLSRVYLGVHWTTDVLGGYLTGFILLFFILYFYRRLRRLETA